MEDESLTKIVPFYALHTHTHTQYVKHVKLMLRYVAQTHKVEYDDIKVSVREEEKLPRLFLLRNRIAQDPANFLHS